MAREGFSIYIVDRDPEECHSTQRQIQEMGVSCQYMIYDFSGMTNPHEAHNFIGNLR